MKPASEYLIIYLPCPLTFSTCAYDYPLLTFCLVLVCFLSKCRSSNSYWNASAGINSEIKMLVGCFFRASFLESTYIGIEIKDLSTDRERYSIFVNTIKMRLNLFLS